MVKLLKFHLFGSSLYTFLQKQIYFQRKSLNCYSLDDVWRSHNHFRFHINNNQVLYMWGQPNLRIKRKRIIHRNVFSITKSIETPLKYVFYNKEVWLNMLQLFWSSFVHTEYKGVACKKNKGFALTKNKGFSYLYTRNSFL